MPMMGEIGVPPTPEGKFFLLKILKYKCLESWICGMSLLTAEDVVCLWELGISCLALNL